MSSQQLQKARVYETRADREIRPEDRPAFHLTPRIGWMNDPNGFSYYDGQYHLFYQYYPYDTKWGPMHWGHAVSKDLLHWEYLPAALAPDTGADKDGCFSGSAITLPDGRQALVYTGVVNETQADGRILGIQTQCLAIGDGVDYAKSDQNPLLDESSLPVGISRYDFRDPKVWQEADGTYRMLCAARTVDETDTMYLLFRSRDMQHWSYERVFLRNNSLEHPIGRMYECPDFFPLGDQYVLLASSQDMVADGEHAAGNGTFCMIGSYDAATGTFIPESSQNVDGGIDFYAEQSVLAPDGRRIMLGWMQNWDTLMHRPDHCKWYGQTTIPRELSIRDGRLYQWPIQELDSYRRNKVTYQDVPVGENGDLAHAGISGRQHESGATQAAQQIVELGGVHGRVADLEIEISPVEGEPAYSQFTIGLAVDDTHHTDVIYRPEESRLMADRRSSGTKRALAHVCDTGVESPDGRIHLRIILDRYSAEIFVNDGEQVLTMTFYTEQTADRITFSARGKARMNITKYDLVL